MKVHNFVEINDFHKKTVYFATFSIHAPDEVRGGFEGVRGPQIRFEEGSRRFEDPQIRFEEGSRRFEDPPYFTQNAFPTHFDTI
jgi:hypothetical protein